MVSLVSHGLPRSKWPDSTEPPVFDAVCIISIICIASDASGQGGQGGDFGDLEQSYFCADFGSNGFGYHGDHASRKGPPEQCPRSVLAGSGG